MNFAFCRNFSYFLTSPLPKLVQPGIFSGVLDFPTIYFFLPFLSLLLNVSVLILITRAILINVSFRFCVLNIELCLVMNLLFKSFSMLKHCLVQCKFCNNSYPLISQHIDNIIELLFQYLVSYHSHSYFLTNKQLRKGKPHQLLPFAVCEMDGWHWGSVCDCAQNTNTLNSAP